jgi:hypothetical protein
MVLLVHRTVQDAARRKKCVLGTVPMVDIPVNDGNPVNALEGVFRSYRRVVQEAEPHRMRPLRVMAGGADEGKGMFSVQGPVHRADSTPGCMQGCIEGTGGDIRVGVEMGQGHGFRTALPEVFRVMGGMDPVHLLKGGRFGKYGRNAQRDTRECSQQAGLTLRMVRVFVTGTGRIDDYGAASHFRVHPSLQLPEVWECRVIHLAQIRPAGGCSQYREKNRAGQILTRMNHRHT